MMMRYFRKRSTDEWLVATMGGAAVTTVDAAVHVADLARGLGIGSDDLEAVDSESDPRSGTLLIQPAPLDRRTDEQKALADLEADADSVARDPVKLAVALRALARR